MGTVAGQFEIVVARLIIVIIDKTIEYPAQYGIKVMGLAQTGFNQIVKSILRSHSGGGQSVVYSYKKSAKQKYITCTFEAQSRQQLDQVYTQIRVHPKVLMVR